MPSGGEVTHLCGFARWLSFSSFCQLQVFMLLHCFPAAQGVEWFVGKLGDPSGVWWLLSIHTRTTRSIVASATGLSAIVTWYYSARGCVEIHFSTIKANRRNIKVFPGCNYNLPSVLISMSVPDATMISTQGDIYNNVQKFLNALREDVTFVTYNLCLNTSYVWVTCCVSEQRPLQCQVMSHVFCLWIETETELETLHGITRLLYTYPEEKSVFVFILFIWIFQKMVCIGNM